MEAEQSKPFGYGLVPLGVHAMIGAPGTGKTYRALEDARAIAKAYGSGLLVIDSVTSPTLSGVRHVAKIEDLLPVWTDAAELAFIPRTLEDFERIMRLCAEPTVGNVVVLIDEVFPWRRSKELIWLCRTWRASRCTVFMTTQNPTGDVMADLQAAEPCWYIFRLSHARALEWIEKHHGMNPEEVSNLPNREFIELI